MKEIMGKNFIGPEELETIAASFPIQKITSPIPELPFSLDVLKNIKDDYILILGVLFDRAGNPLTLLSLRSLYGLDPAVKEPCFYNQDWYVKEAFAAETHLNFQWYLIKKEVIAETRAQDPKIIAEAFKKGEQFPSAILVAYTFFAYYCLYNELLWNNDFIWCSDTDHNGDRIYVGRYTDPNKINKNGFNIHRHLSLRQAYGFVPEIKA
ncbi:MAG: hypothetical protein Q8R26_01800 [bacterium]|nr:hypothetical protein [bacterium]